MKFIVDFSLFRYLDHYCHANDFDPEGFKKLFAWEGWAKKNPTFRQDFETIIQKRLMSREEFTERTDIEFDTDDELFTFLQALYDYLYKDGPYPSP